MSPKNSKEVTPAQPAIPTGVPPLLRELRADCERCFGLCCVALYFSTMDGFPTDKSAGSPCRNLHTDFTCKVHSSLKDKGLKGCLSFDCLGAGQKVAQTTFNGKDWKKHPELAQGMFDSFLIMLRLHEILWYLTEALSLPCSNSLHDTLFQARDEVERTSETAPENLRALDITALWVKVSPTLDRVSDLARNEALREGPPAQRNFKPRRHLMGTDLRNRNLAGANLKGVCLIAADLRGCSLAGTNFMGADLRDADLRKADLSKSIFLTQGQLNAARGDDATRLPPLLVRPERWLMSSRHHEYDLK